MLEIKDLHVHFGSTHAVRGVTLSIGEKERVGIVGRSGSGKSSLANAIMTRYLRPGLDVGMVFQDPMTALNPTMRIGEQIIEGFLYHKLGTHAEAKARALLLLHKMGFLDPKEKFEVFPHQLSGGQRQRVVLAIAMMCRPKLLICDEPTTALDATTKTQILELIKSLDVAILLISHDLSVIHSVCTRVLTMENGLFTSHSPTLPSIPTPAPVLSSSPLLSVTKLSHYYALDKKRFVFTFHNVNFTIHKGEIVGLMGDSGSGKSTLAKILLGILKPSGGIVEFEGKRTDMQMIFQDPYATLNPRMTVEQMLSEPTRIHHLPNRTDELLDLVKLPRQYKNRYPHALSGGERQRISIARALALSPKLLIADEPISALDPGTAVSILELLRDFQATLGLSILFISHDEEIVKTFCNRALFLHTPL